MKKLTIKELQFLRHLYANKGPKYIPTVGLLDHFIHRFENHPEWMDKVQFLTINESTLNDGTFVMDYYTVDGPFMAFNSLESKPYRNLERLLNALNFSGKKICKFLTISEEFRALIDNLIKAKHLEILEDNNSICTVFKTDYDKVLKLLQKAPEGFYYDSLKKSDVPKIKSTLSYIIQSGYLETIIKYNPTVGLYTHDGELIAWHVMHETGESGMLEVVPKYKRRGFGKELVLRLALQYEDMGRLSYGHVFYGNNVATDFNEKVNFKFRDGTVVGTFRYMAFRQRVNENSKTSKL